MASIDAKLSTLLHATLPPYFLAPYLAPPTIIKRRGYGNSNLIKTNVPELIMLVNSVKTLVR